MPYRTNAKLTTVGPRWGVTWRRRWYVRVARVFVNLRAPYIYQREMEAYYRDLRQWKRERDQCLLDEHKRPCLKPYPCPPPIYINE